MTRAEQLHSSTAASTRAASFLYMVRPLNFQHGTAVVVGQLQRDLAAIQAAIDKRVGDGDPQWVLRIVRRSSRAPYLVELSATMSASAGCV